MKFAAITQRTAYYPEIGETRDELDQQWTKFLAKIGFLPIPIPNIAGNLSEYFKTNGIRAIILSGGGNLKSLAQHDLSPDREKIEEQLIKYAIKHAIPCIGVCRGMQKICTFFNSTCVSIDGHVASRHTISFDPEMKEYKNTKEVNSFHNFGPTIDTIKFPLSILAHSDNIVEAIRHKNYPIFGIMWHPEREKPFRNADINFFHKIFA